MTIGIYALFWETADVIYIGQSECIERRTKEHLRSLAKGTHFNHKVQKAYTTLGPPQVLILSECSISELDTEEALWVREFDSINTGLNIAEPGKIISSIISRHSKYSKIQVYKVFVLLIRGHISMAKIAKRTKVHVSTVKSIAAGVQHTWLSEAYPTEYQKMLQVPREQNTSSNGARPCTSYMLTNPKGVIFYTSNLKEFCKKEPTLCSNCTSAYSILHRISVGYGRNKTYKGWIAVQV
jgi:hypothetical protein